MTGNIQHTRHDGPLSLHAQQCALPAHSLFKDFHRCFPFSPWQKLLFCHKPLASLMLNCTLVLVLWHTDCHVTLRHERFCIRRKEAWWAYIKGNWIIWCEFETNLSISLSLCQVRLRHQQLLARIKKTNYVVRVSMLDNYCYKLSFFFFYVPFL